MLKIYRLTKPELDFYEEKCNFTEDEEMCFKMRSKNKSIVEIALKMNISERKVSSLIKNVKDKIYKVKTKQETS